MVPGVTSPLGIAAYSGIPLTHREHTKVVTFVTGHDVHGIDWSKVGQSETLVIFMGIFAIREIAAEIQRHGRSGETPAVAVRWGTRPDQETVVGTLATVAWALFGSVLRPFLKSSRMVHAFNMVMALLLLASLYPVFMNT